MPLFLDVGMESVKVRGRNSGKEEGRRNRSRKKREETDRERGIRNGAVGEREKNGVQNIYTNEIRNALCCLSDSQ